MSKSAYAFFGEEMLEKDAKIEQLEQELNERSQAFDVQSQALKKQTDTLDQLAKRVAQLESIIRASGGTVPG